MTRSDDAPVVETILRIKEEILKLRETAGHLPCVDRNCERLLSSVAMLELDVVDVWTLYQDETAKGA